MEGKPAGQIINIGIRRESKRDAEVTQKIGTAVVDTSGIPVQPTMTSVLWALPPPSDSAPGSHAYTLLHTLTSATTNYTRSGYLPRLSPILPGNLVLCFRAPVNSENFVQRLYLWAKNIREEQLPETEQIAAFISSGFALSGSRPPKGPGDIPVFLEHPCFL